MLFAGFQEAAPVAESGQGIGGDQPQQLFLASPVPRPRWWGNGDIVVGTVLAGVGLLVIGPVVWGATAMLPRRGWPTGSPMWCSSGN